MDVPKQEVVRKGVGDAGERAGHKVEIVQAADAGAATQTKRVNLDGDSAS